ncbi:hypothetical protein J6590_013114 [Homalodisca vitripennis]|nr:hypothetical protein J6590_013114 [Homalodisca vitripennis]
MALMVKMGGEHVGKQEVREPFITSAPPGGNHGNIDQGGEGEGDQGRGVGDGACLCLGADGGVITKSFEGSELIWITKTPGEQQVPEQRLYRPSEQTLSTCGQLLIAGSGNNPATRPTPLPPSPTKLLHTAQYEYKQSGCPLICTGITPIFGIQRQNTTLDREPKKARCGKFLAQDKPQGQGYSPPHDQSRCCDSCRALLAASDLALADKITIF